MNFNIAGKDYTVDVTPTMSLSNLKDKIYDATAGKITASILNVGGSNPYKMTLKSTDTGSDNAITFTSTGGGTAVTDLGFDNVANHIQPAANAEFTYNNVAISRQSNNISDLIVGVTLNINDVGQSNISIKQDTSSISDSITSFVKDYNSLMSSLDSSTSYDPTTKTAGIFQGTSEVRDLKAALSRQLSSVNSQGKSLSDYGVSLNSAGLLEINQDTLNSNLSSNLSGVEDFFRGNSTTNTTGYFTDFNSLLSSYTDTTTGILTQLNTQFDTQATSLANEKQKATDSLDSKYSALTSKFIAYDSMISQMNSSFQSLNMQIQSLTNSSSKS